MRISRLECVAVASHLPLFGAEISPRKMKEGRVDGILENDCSRSAATTTSCVVLHKPGFVLRTTPRQAVGVPLRKSEVRIVSRRSFVENAISSLKRLGTRAYQTQARRTLPRCSEGRRNSFLRRGLSGARGIRIAFFAQTLWASVQKIQNLSQRQPRRAIRRPDSGLTLCHNAASLSD